MTGYTYYKLPHSKKYHLNYTCKLLHRGCDKTASIRVITTSRPVRIDLCVHCAKVGFIPNDHPKTKENKYV